MGYKSADLARKANAEAQSRVALFLHLQTVMRLLSLDALLSFGTINAASPWDMTLSILIEIMAAVILLGQGLVALLYAP